MMNRYYVLTILILSFGFTCCKKTNSTEKFQQDRNNVTRVVERIKPLNTNLYFGQSYLTISHDLLFINELTMHSSDKCIHIFNKNTFKYLASTGIMGRGPGEITRPGHIAVDEKNRIILINDHARRLMWKIPIDSALSNSNFKPSDNIPLEREMEFFFFNITDDNSIIGRAVRPLSTSSFEVVTAKLNASDLKIEEFGYCNPKATGRWMSNSHLAYSKRNSIYAIAFEHIDLLTICNADGSLVANIYGPGWGKEKFNHWLFHNGVAITSKYIITSYLGGERAYLDEYQRQSSKNPTKLCIFDLKGTYLKTLELESQIISFCVDEENNRIIAYVDGRENPLVYFNLE